MVHLTLQLGAALVIPFDTPRCMTDTGRGWRNRALRAAVASSEVVGMWQAVRHLADDRSFRSRSWHSRQPAFSGASQ